MRDPLVAERVTAKAVWNLILAMAPLLATVIALPVTLREVGVVQYGILQTSLAVAGLLAVADLNFGVALTRFVASSRGAGDEEGAAEFVWTGFALFLGLGLAASGAVIAIAPWLMSLLLDDGSVRASYGVDSLRLAGAALVPLFLATWATGVANGFHRFVLPSSINAANLVLTTLGNAFLAVNGADVRELMAWNALVSYVAAGVLFAYISRIVPRRRAATRIDPARARALLGFAGFSSMGRIANLIGTTADRVVVAAALGPAAVPLYAIPTTLMRYLAGAGTKLGAVLFPIAAHLDARRQLPALRTMYIRAARVFATFAVGLPLITAGGADLWLHSWLGPAFAGSAAAVLALAAVLTCLSLLTIVPSYVADGLGKPHVTGTMNLLQNGAGLVIAVVLTSSFGVAGTAFAFLLPALVMAPLFIRTVERRYLSLDAVHVLRIVYMRPLAVAVIVSGGTRALASLFSPASPLLGLAAFALASLLYAAAVIVLRPIPPADLRTLFGSRRFLLSPLRSDETVPA